MEKGWLRFEECILETAEISCGVAKVANKKIPRMELWREELK